MTMNDHDQPDAYAATSYRAITASLGSLLILLAVAMPFLADPAKLGLALIASLVVGILGGDALCSAWRGKCSLLSRIGPLP